MESQVITDPKNTELKVIKLNQEQVDAMVRLLMKIVEVNGIPEEIRQRFELYIQSEKPTSSS